MHVSNIQFRIKNQKYDLQRRNVSPLYMFSVLFIIHGILCGCLTLQKVDKIQSPT